MRYIKKGNEPEFMTSWKKLRHQAGQNLVYNDFDKKAELNEVLRAEQHHICCYCQQRLEHFQGNKVGGSHNEHLIPEYGGHGDFEKQMDYSNLYACCIDSRGLKKKEREKRHCGEAKEDKLIRGFIQEENCSSFFRYNILGEIIPNGDYNSWADYLNHEANLSGDVKDAMEAINVLNLNCHFLKEDRKRELDALVRVISHLSKEKVNEKMRDFEGAETYPRYIDLLLFFMAKKK